ncbi:hypothetical protein H632_c2225p0 [Helicosporidium sp. ATCC 50920]|nr:hypothetical protein H632_c2225p0 [Helicosporidium sp. ATCC 50920]|eukprot:KDD73392.1 hypothetical protein H632_c2225p0 [Helicosporidium sp. ATCC 50920]
MRKRVALARAIVRSAAGAAEDQVLLYDEPTAGLDPVASTVVEDLIRSLHVQDDPRGARGEFNGSDVVMSESDDGSVGSVGGIRSYLVVTHQQSTIRRAVDRIIFLHQGKVVWEGSVAEMDSTDEKIVRQFASGSLDGPIAYM